MWWPLALCFVVAAIGAIWYALATEAKAQFISIVMWGAGLLGFLLVFAWYVHG
jgi:hypothetical protein